MKMVIDRNDLKIALDNISGAVPVRSVSEVQMGVKLDARKGEVKLTGFDLSFGVVSACPTLIIDEEGSLVVNYKLLSQVVNSLPKGEIHFSAEGGKLQIVSTSTKFSLPYMEAENFPRLPEEENSKFLFSIKEKELRKLIIGTSFACMKNDSRPIMQGVLFQQKSRKLQLMASDGYRAAIRETQIERSQEEGYSFVLLGKAVTFLSKMIDADGEQNTEVYEKGSFVIFKTSDGTIAYLKKMEGEFVDIMKNVKNLSPVAVGGVKRIELVDSVKRTSLFDSRQLMLEFKQKKLVLAVNDVKGKFRDEIVAEGTAEMTLAVNSNYLAEIISAIPEENIRFALMGDTKPIVIRSEKGADEKYLYLLLPMRYRK